MQSDVDLANLLASIIGRPSWMGGRRLRRSPGTRKGEPWTSTAAVAGNAPAANASPSQQHEPNRVGCAASRSTTGSTDGTETDQRSTTSCRPHSAGRCSTRATSNRRTRGATDAKLLCSSTPEPTAEHANRYARHATGEAHSSDMRAGREGGTPTTETPHRKRHPALLPSLPTRFPPRRQNP